MRVCPICGKEYSEYPALSRRDNVTLVCPDCEIREAMASMGRDAAEGERVVQVVNAHKARENFRLVDKK